MLRDPPLTGVSARWYPWVVLAVVFLAGVAATLNQFEVPPGAQVAVIHGRHLRTCRSTGPGAGRGDC